MLSLSRLDDRAPNPELLLPLLQVQHRALSLALRYNPTGNRYNVGDCSKIKLRESRPLLPREVGMTG